MDVNSPDDATTNGPGFALHTVEDGGERCVIQLTGELDAASQPELRARVRDLVGNGCRDIVLDMSQVGFMDSAGLGALIAGQKIMDGIGGVLTVASPSASVARVFELTATTERFTGQRPAEVPNT